MHWQGAATHYALCAPRSWSWASGNRLGRAKAGHRRRLQSEDDDESGRWEHDGGWASAACQPRTRARAANRVPEKQNDIAPISAVVFIGNAL